jgi:hypothetical protein
VFLIFFIFPRNSKYGAAEQKCSAEHRLRNPGLDTIKMRITLGSYQIKMSKSYLAEHLKQKGKYTVYIKKDFQINQHFKTLMCIIQSRHSNAKKYYLFIKYKIMTDEDKRKNVEALENDACENL